MHAMPLRTKVAVPEISGRAGLHETQCPVPRPTRMISSEKVYCFRGLRAIISSIASGVVLRCSSLVAEPAVGGCIMCGAELGSSCLERSSKDNGSKLLLGARSNRCERDEAVDAGRWTTQDRY